MVHGKAWRSECAVSVRFWRRGRPFVVRYQKNMMLRLTPAFAPRSRHDRRTHTCAHYTRHTRHTRHTRRTRHTRHTRHTTHNTQHTTHNTLHTAHGTRHTAHCTLHTAHCTLHTTHYTLHTHTTHHTLTPHTTHHTPHTTHDTRHTTHDTQHTTHNTQHTTHNTQHTTHNTQHTTHNTQHTAHCTLHTAHCTLHTAHCTLHTHTTHHTLTPHTTHHTPHTTHNAQRTTHTTQRTAHSAQRTAHNAQRTTHNTLRTPHTAHRTPHTAQRTTHNAQRTLHIAQRTATIALAHWHHKPEHARGSCAECRSTASADTPMARTRVHHAIRHCVANMCRKAGLNSEEEVVIPELHEKAHDGTVKEARMDVVVWRPGGLERWMIDVRTVDGKSATAIALGGPEGAFRSAEQEKHRRYLGHAQAPSVELSGGIASTGLSLLERLSWEAAVAKPSNGSPTLLVRQWCRELELVLAFEAAEALRAVHARLLAGEAHLFAQSEQSALCLPSFV